MSFWIYFSIYTFSLVIIWGFFIIARIHSLKFKNYQPKIEKVTNITTITLFIFSILGYIFIFFVTPKSNVFDIREIVPQNNTGKQIEDFSDISEKNSEIIPKNIGENYY